MSHHVAFLRAINVGGRRVTMEVLASLFRQLDLEGVSTFIASGNVVFAHPGDDLAGLEARIEAHLSGALGYEVDTFVRSAEDLARIAAFDDLDEADGHRLRVGFVKTPLSTDALSGLASDREFFVCRGRELYWLTLDTTRDSKVSGAVLERALGQATTLRRLHTVQRLVARLE